MSDAKHDRDVEWLRQRLAEHLTIGPDGMTPADRWNNRPGTAGWAEVSMSTEGPVSFTEPHIDDASTIIRELLTQELVASLTPSLPTEEDAPASREPVVEDALDAATLETDPSDPDVPCIEPQLGDDRHVDEALWSIFVDSWRRSAPLFGTNVH